MVQSDLHQWLVGLVPGFKGSCFGQDGALATGFFLNSDNYSHDARDKSSKDIFG